MVRAVHAKKIVIHLSGSGHLFEKKNCQLFAWLEVSVQNKIVLCWNSSGYLFKKSCQLFEQFRLSVRKKLATVQKLDKEKVSRVSIPEQFPHQPLVPNHLLFSRYSWVVPLWTLFTNVSWIVTALFLPLPHLFRHPFSHSISKGLVTPFSPVHLPCVRIPCIVCKEHFWVRGHIFEVNGIVVQ